MAGVSEAGELAAEYRWIANAEADAWSRELGNRSRVARGGSGRRNRAAAILDRLGVDFLEAVGAKIEVNRRHNPVEEA